MSKKHLEDQVLSDYNHMYFFEHRGQNRTVHLGSLSDFQFEKIDNGMQVGMIFSKRPIVEQKYSITKQQDILDTYGGKIIYFENFKEF